MPVLCTQSQLLGVIFMRGVKQMEKPAHKLESGQYIIGPVGLAMSGVYLILSRVAKMPLYGPGAQVVNHSIVRLDIKCYFAKVPESGYVVGRVISYVPVRSQKKKSKDVFSRIGGNLQFHSITEFSKKSWMGK